MTEEMIIIKQTGEKITFSLNAIIAAVNDILDGAFDELFEETKTLWTRISEWFQEIMHYFMHKDKQEKESTRGCSLRMRAFFLTVILYSSVKPLTLTFQEFSKIIRNVNLQRNQHRGSDTDNTGNSYQFVLVTLKI